MGKHWAKNEHTEQVQHHNILIVITYLMHSSSFCVLNKEQKAFTKSEY